MCSTKLEARLLASSTPPWPPTHLSLYTCHQLSDQRARSWQDRLDSQVRSAHCHSRITAALTPVYSPLQVQSPGQESELIPIIISICSFARSLQTVHTHTQPDNTPSQQHTKYQHCSSFLAEHSCHNGHHCHNDQEYDDQNGCNHTTQFSGAFLQSQNAKSSQHNISLLAQLLVLPCTLQPFPVVH